MLLGFPLGMLLSSKGQSGSYRILYFILDCAKQQSVSSGVTEHSAQHGSAAAGPLEWVPPPAMRTVLSLLGVTPCRRRHWEQRGSLSCLFTHLTHISVGAPLGGQALDRADWTQLFWGVTNDHVIKVPVALKWPAWLCQPEGGSEPRGGGEGRGPGWLRAATGGDVTGHWAARGAAALTAEPGSCLTHRGGWVDRGPALRLWGCR